jgi:site-specific recombinase XerD
MLLTDQIVKNELLCPPGKKKVEMCDTQVPGLLIEILAVSPGVGTYRLRYKAIGKTRYQRIGRTTDTTLADARIAAKKLKAEIALGENPSEKTKVEKAVLTLKTFLEEKYLPYVTPRKRSARFDESMTRLRIGPRLGHLRLNQLTRSAIQEFHTSLKAEGLAGATCDHHIKMIRHALNLAVQWDLLDRNPATKVPLFREDNRLENYMDDEQLQKLMEILKSDSNRNVCNLALFLLSTGARLNEALQAEWSQIEKQTRVWRIPATNSKSKKIRSIPLNDSALEVLEKLGTEGKFTWLFVNRKTKERLGYVHKVWDRIRIAAGLPKLRIHDLRHQYASFLVNGGRTLYEVQQILGHSDPTVTQRYAHLSTKALQDAANTASTHLQSP